MDNENEEGLLGTGPYDAEDEEADRIYAAVDLKMDERRRKRREVQEKEQLEQYRLLHPKIQEQFSDLKRSLADVSEDEWANLPEPGDLRAVGRKMRKVREKERERFTPMPDSILAAARASTQLASQIPAETPTSGLETPSGLITPIADFRQISQARDDLLKVKLDQITDSVGGQSSVDPRGYLTDLNSMALKSDAEIGDIKKARELLKSVITTNPKHGPGWISAARVEEIDGNLVAARSLITRGCEECGKSEDVWLEAARLNTPQNAKVIFANSVRELPQSVKIWLAAAQLESEPKAKKRVLRRALEFIPHSIKLWKAAIELEEDPDDARILLSRAVECVPLSVELWIALARLETYENGKKVLNRARLACPNSVEIWIAAARLEEFAGNERGTEMIIQRSVTTLSSKGVNLNREQWLAEAEKSELAGSLKTCQCIIRATIAQDLEDQDIEELWIADAELCLARKNVATARAIYAHALTIFPHQESVWQRAASLEKDHGTKELLLHLLAKAVANCPQAEGLWLMQAKEQWLSGDVEGARLILLDAFKQNPNSEQIWLAAVKLEIENGEYEQGRQLLRRAREQASTERVWMKSVLLERNLGDLHGALELVSTALNLYPKFAKFWMMKSQMEIQLSSATSTALPPTPTTTTSASTSIDAPTLTIPPANPLASKSTSSLQPPPQLSHLQQAQETLGRACRICPDSIPLWIIASRLEEQLGNRTRSRALLDKARLLNPSTALIWLEAVRIDLRADNLAMAKALLSKALQECPSSGSLWVEAIFLEPKSSRKTKSVDALKRCENNALVVVAVALLFWSERNVEKARSWFQRGLKFNPDIGDAWAWLLKFESMHGTDEQKQDVVRRTVEADPHHGEMWGLVAKDPLNWKKSTAEILFLVADSLSDIK